MPSDKIDYGALEPRIQAWAVAQGLTVRDVSCPDHAQVDVGGTFGCALTEGNGAVDTNTVTLATSDGSVTWAANE